MATSPKTPAPRKRTPAAKPVAKRAAPPVVKAPVKAPVKTPVKAAKPAAAPKPARPEAAPKKREKLVRDSFTIPKGEYAVLAALKKRAEALARPAKKSELLRAGVKLLAALDDAAFLAALAAVPAIKTGRPAAT